MLCFRKCHINLKFISENIAFIIPSLRSVSGNITRSTSNWNFVIVCNDAMIIINCNNKLMMIVFQFRLSKLILLSTFLFFTQWAMQPQKCHISFLWRIIRDNYMAYNSFFALVFVIKLLLIVINKQKNKTKKYVMAGLGWITISSVIEGTPTIRSHFH